MVPSLRRTVPNRLRSVLVPAFARKLLVSRGGHSASQPPAVPQVAVLGLSAVSMYSDRAPDAVAEERTIPFGLISVDTVGVSTAGMPSVWVRYHWPLNAETSSPLTSFGAVSATNVYSGLPK